MAKELDDTLGDNEEEIDDLEDQVNDVLTKGKTLLYTSLYIDFYDCLYAQRLRWTNHYIPVRYRRPDGLYTEGYIRTVKKREDDLHLLFYKVFSSGREAQTIEVPYKSLYPTYRKFTHLSICFPVTESPVDPIQGPEAIMKDIPPTPLVDIHKIFDTYPGASWTAAEICSMLAAPGSEQFVAKLPNLEQKGTKLCLIKNQVEAAYVLRTLTAPTISTPTKVATSIHDLKDQYNACTRCALGQSRKDRGASIVFGRGNVRDPQIFVIGEAPGAQEEEHGVPFFTEAPAGSILYKVMTAAGIDQNTDCYITNSVLCRPVIGDANGKPEANHITECNSRLKTELALLKPKVVLLLGAYAFRSFYGKDAGSISSRLGWQEEHDKYSVYLAYHPSYIARQLNFAKPEDKSKVKAEYLTHFTEIKKKINGSTT